MARTPLSASLLCILVLVSSVFAQFDRFDITVTGSFRHTGIAGIEDCDYCDCTIDTGDCSWHDDFTCTNPSQYTAHGADDNQQRWGDCDSDCNCFPNSAIGFQGVADVPVFANQPEENVTLIGIMSHYNNVIDEDTPTRLRLTITLTAPQLASSFVIGFPLQFIETPNEGGGVAFCDPGIQRTDVPCDDRFSFSALTVQDSFQHDNVEYTLVVVGFLNDGDLGQPLNKFITEERRVTRAGLYARIVTFCLDTQCGVNEDFIPSPNCTCLCGISDFICKDVFGADWMLDPSGCDCLCSKNGSDCPVDQPFNPDTCGCGCALTEAECEAQNPSYGLAVAPLCACDCKKQKYLDCHDENPFYRPSQDENCECVCEISDGACERYFGDGFTADFPTCTCIPPEDGLDGGEIAGIVIGSVAGAVLLLVLAAVAAGTLVWLIRSGKIPGIYGYKVADADLSAAQNSPFYSDVWSHNTNAAEGS